MKNFIRVGAWALLVLSIWLVLFELPMNNIVSTAISGVLGAVLCTYSVYLLYVFHLNQE